MASTRDHKVSLADRWDKQDTISGIPVLLALLIISTPVKIHASCQDQPDVPMRPAPNITQYEMSIAVSPLNKDILLVASNSDECPYNTGAIGYYISTNGGVDWTGQDLFAIGDCLNEDCGVFGDPATAFDRDGYFYVGGLAGILDGMNPTQGK